ncbi:MAG: asparagine synthase (glutamine-hydrolyzing) [Bacteroidales bacterium]|nr:asparagine synthase (glutamine-hydrolyzing) [Bacteroidales bacterium]
MCGIIGLINKNQEVAELGIIKAMAEKIAHRGPDDENHYLHKHFGFYHKRLSIIDLEHGRQPMVDEELILTFNGEIYNYIELRNELKAKGYAFKTDSDTEVILKMYREYGDCCVDKLNGMFAFLLYDKRKNLLLVARDHFGIKPLYYFINENRILFASEIKALLAHPDAHPEPDFNAIREYLTFQYTLEHKTLYKDIEKVLPGHLMVIDLNTFEIKRKKYWEPNFHVDNHHTETYFTEKLKELLEDTVKIQLRSDVPLGTYLSGGMDSSLVSVLAARNLTGQIKTFTGAFSESKDFDETEYAREVAGIIKAQRFEVYPTASQFVELMPKLIYHLDEPVVGPGVFPQYMVSKLAKDNVTVVLGGQGGDEIFGGYSRYVIAYFEQVIKGAIFETNDEGEHIVSLESILPNLPYLHRYIPMMTDFWKKGAFKDADRRYFDLLDRSSGELKYYSKEFTKEFDKEVVYSTFKRLFNHPDTKSYFNKMTHFDMFGSLPGLLQVEDRVSMAVSLESRVPLLDRRIVDLVSSMPPAMKFKGGEMKYILKRAIRDWLPPTILNRKDKMGFPVPLHLWAKNGAHDFICDTLMSSKSKQRGLYNHKKIEKLIESERPFGRELWGLLSLELWFSTFIDN